MARRTQLKKAKTSKTAGIGCPFGHMEESPNTQPQMGLVDSGALDRATIAAALDPIITIDSRGIIHSASDSVKRVLGWDASELLGKNVKILMPEPHHSAHDGYLANYHRTGQTNILNRPRRFEALRKDGRLIPIELCVSRAEIPGSTQPMFVGLIRDMSSYAAAERGRDEERVRSHQQLAEQTAALQQATLRLRMADRMASIGTLAAGLGHDMNNVLLPVRARLDALKAAVEHKKIPASEQKHIDEIRKSVAYLQQLADGLHFLAMDPDASEDVRGGGVTTDLRQWWSQVGALLSKAVPKHVRVIASFGPELPLLELAAHGLTQAVLNLVVNAGEAIPGPAKRKRRQGYVRLTAQPHIDYNRHWVRLNISDNGTGMSEEVRLRAFEMFFTTKPRGLGTGLGLALVRKVADRAGGRVEIASEVGKGTTVTMLLPAIGRASENRDADVPFAAISVGDSRAASLIEHMLTTAGVPVNNEVGHPRSAIWVVDPDVDLHTVQKWKRSDGRRLLVLFGKPQSRLDDWGEFDPLRIEDPSNFEMIRSAIGQAISSIKDL